MKLSVNSGEASNVLSIGNCLPAGDYWPDWERWMKELTYPLTYPLTWTSTYVQVHLFTDAGDSYATSMDIPGCNPDDVEVYVEDRTVTIKAKRADTGFVYNYTLAIPGPVNEQGDASYQNGVLRLAFQKINKKQKLQLKL